METIKMKRRQSKTPTETIQVDAEKEDFDKDVDEENFQPTIENGEALLEVECGTNKAKLFLAKLAEGSKGPCVFFHGSWLTPNEFQYVSGRATAKDWKRSIRYNGKSLKLLFAKGILSLGAMTKNGRLSKKKTKKRPGRKSKGNKDLTDEKKERDAEKEELKDHASSDQQDDSSTENSTTSHDSETDFNDTELDQKQEQEDEKEEIVELGTINTESCIDNKKEDVDFLDDDTEMASDEECNLAEVTCEDTETRRNVDDIDDTAQNTTEDDTPGELLSQEGVSETTVLTEVIEKDENDVNGTDGSENDGLEKQNGLAIIENKGSEDGNDITNTDDNLVIPNPNIDRVAIHHTDESNDGEINSQDIEKSSTKSDEFTNASEEKVINMHYDQDGSAYSIKNIQNVEVKSETETEARSPHEQTEEFSIKDNNCEDRQSPQTVEAISVSQFRPIATDDGDLSKSSNSTVNTIDKTTNNADNSEKMKESSDFTVASKANYLSKLLQELRESKQEHCYTSSCAEITSRSPKSEKVSEKTSLQCTPPPISENHKIGRLETSTVTKSQASENYNSKIKSENVIRPTLDIISMANDKRHNGLIGNQPSMKHNTFRGQQQAPTKAENYSDYMRMLASTCVQPSIYLSQYAADRIFPFKSTEVCMPPGACPPHFPFGLKFPPPKCMCCVPSTENRTSPISPPFYSHLQRPSHDFPLPLFNPYFAIPPPLLPPPWTGSTGDKNQSAKRTLPKEGNILDLSPKKVKFSFNEA